MKNIRTVLIVLILIAMAVGAYFFLNKNTTPDTSSTGNQTQNLTSSSKSLKELLSSGVAQKCSYKTSFDGTSTEGATLVANGKIRNDFTFSENGKETITHMISDGKTSYIWTEGEKTGFKMTVESLDETSTDPATQQGSVQGGTDWNEKFDYDCSPTVVSDSSFTPPSDIEFVDFSSLLKNLPN